MPEGDTLTRSQTRAKTSKAPLFKVLLLNDDYTPMDFVVAVLMRYFRKNEAEAVQVMLHVHQKGVGICGVYSFEIAETKVAQVNRAARQEGYPLRCIMEEE